MANPHDRPVALVTGASAGLGAAFARALAARGCDLILVARRRERLETLAEELRQERGAQAEALPADLADLGDVQRVEERIHRAAHLDYLISNAGFGVRGFFADSDINRHTAMAQVHVLASMRLTRAALPGMLDRGSGNIVHVSSLGSFIALPGSIHYYATKAYLNTFCIGLSREVAGTGVRVQALCPGFTRTEFHQTPEYAGMRAYERIPKFYWDSAERVVEASLRHLPRGPVVYVPFFKNQVLAFGGQIGLAGLFFSILRGWFQHRR